jgi:hypothetical protein
MNSAALQQRHRWIRVGGHLASDVDRWICRHCGMVRQRSYMPREYVFVIPGDRKPAEWGGFATRSASPPYPCPREWPAGWRPLHAAKVRPDLFKE